MHLRRKTRTLQDTARGTWRNMGSVKSGWTHDDLLEDGVDVATFHEWLWRSGRDEVTSVAIACLT